MRILDEQETKEFAQKFNCSFSDAKLIVKYIFDRYKEFYYKGWEDHCPLNTVEEYVYFTTRAMWRGTKAELLDRYKWDIHNSFESIIVGHKVIALSNGIYVQC